MIKTSKRHHCLRSSVFVFNLNIFHTFFSVSIVVLGQGNVCWEARFRNKSAFSVKSRRGCFLRIKFYLRKNMQIAFLFKNQASNFSGRSFIRKWKELARMCFKFSNASLLKNYAWLNLTGALNSLTARVANI